MAKEFSPDNFLYLWQRLKAKFVVQVPGKGLSTNDLTDTLLDKLNNAGVGSFSGQWSALLGTPPGVSIFSNDAGYQNSAQVAAAIVSAVAAANHLRFEKVASRPAVASAQANVVYLVPIAGATGDDKYDQWVLVDGAWENWGTSFIDLSGYLLKTELVPYTNAEIDAILAM